VLEPVISSEQFRKNWARLIQKIFEVDPLVCSHCQGRLRVVSFIEDPVVIRRILEHLGLRLANAGPIPKAHSPPVPTASSDPFFSQFPIKIRTPPPPRRLWVDYAPFPQFGETWCHQTH
jgi:hypothetical protein